MNIIVLQHIKIEDPGYIKDLMLADGLNLTTIELDEGEKIPNDLSKFDGMFCMGGPMDTFMEMFVDSSDWVMVPNVYGMGLFSDGGIFATKPYICGSAYFMKMMDFKKGEWCNTMDGLYWRFIDRNRKFFLTNPRLSMMVRIFDKMKTDRKKLILSEADKFIKQNTI